MTWLERTEQDNTQFAYVHVGGAAWPFVVLRWGVWRVHGCVLNTGVWAWPYCSRMASCLWCVHVGPLVFGLLLDDND